MLNVLRNVFAYGAAGGDAASLLCIQLINDQLFLLIVTNAALLNPNAS